MLSNHRLRVGLALAATIGFPATPLGAPAKRTPPSFRIYSFAGQPDGSSPSGGLVQDSQGRLYGATSSGGSMNDGTIYRLTRQAPSQWTEEILYSFNGPDGNFPAGPLTLDAAGSVYGVTGLGGANNSGTAFRLTNANGAWNLTVLHSFGATGDGRIASTGMIFGPDGNLFGVTATGGAGNGGTAFELSPDGDTAYYAIVHTFMGGSDGASPLSGLVGDGRRLVGATFGGGASNAGTVFTLSKDAGGAWRERVVYSFNPSEDIAAVFTAQGFAADGHGGFIGCGGEGGPLGKGGVFAIIPPQSATSSWNDNTLYAFGQSAADPVSACDLVKGPGGVIFGTASSGGGAANPGGVVFTLTPPSDGNSSWTETNVLNLSATTLLGGKPTGAVVRRNNVFFGVSSSSRSGGGLAFAFVPF